MLWYNRYIEIAYRPFRRKHMKKLIVKDVSQCAACLSCEQACSEAFYKVYNPKLSCIRVGGNAAEINIDTCTQCGKCQLVCPKGAISQNKKGTYVIDKKLCVGCLACADICPQNVICKSHDNLFATKCIACGICVKACPQEILEIVEE